MATNNFEERLKQHQGPFHPVVPLEAGDKLLLMDFTDKNTSLDDETLANTELFTSWINNKLEAAGARYGIGGYNEHRTIYSRSGLFGSDNVSSKQITGATGENGKSQKESEPRRLHLGIDIWGKPYTRVMSPIDGIVHSYGFNNAFGDYGATIILAHHMQGETFFSLYGHLSLNSIKNIQEGDLILKGDVFAEFGIPVENGHWPPHLHFQLIRHLDGHKGDYPGVCKFSERESYLRNCPDPDLILGMMGRGVR
jgi:murein DD-endopeptidase MepM/ murein hydrolase activator NlpD